MSAKKRGWRWYTIVGFALTALYVFWIARHTSYQEIATLKASELGTFLGGVAGPPAFFWLVLGFFQQGEELRHSADALDLQGEELRNSVEQQRALVEVTREQIEHSRSEREREEAEAIRQAQPSFGVQSSGYTFSGGGASFEFLIANAGATVRNVRLMEGAKFHGEAALLKNGESVSVCFAFGTGEEIDDRELAVEFEDAQGVRRQRIFVFPAAIREGRTVLVRPRGSTEGVLVSQG